MQLVRDDESWFRSEAPVDCPLLGVQVPVMIFTDDAEVRPDQIQALERVLQIPSSAREQLLEPLFADYREVYEAVEEGPEITGPESVWDYVRWTQILIPLQGPSGDRFVFLRGVPEWEEEHHIELFLRNERLTRVGRASGAFLSECFWSWT